MSEKKPGHISLDGMSRKMSRRSMLKSVGGIAATAAVSKLIPPNVRKVLADPPRRRGSFRGIRHVVLLMQENRSFDHYFGTLSGVRGFGDRSAMKLSGGRPVFYQPYPGSQDGYLLPFHLDTRTTNSQKIPSTSHAWSVQHSAWNNGRMDNWIPAHLKADGANGPYVMGYYTRDDIPFQFALAEAFTICDNYHSSILGPTWPNRMYWMTGMIDPTGAGGGPVISNTPIKGGFHWKTYAERLEEAGVSWKVYQQKDNYGTNMLANFKSFQEAPETSPLYRKGIAYGPEGEFEYDAINGKLPAVSWILPTSYQSEHPDYMPADGAAFVASKIDAIAANPELWAETVFILNYDENDGLFDHVPPPVPDQGTPDEFVDGKPIGAGFRVPCILVSPWTAGGWVCSDRFDHTSVLQFLEKFTGVREQNITRWRRDTFGDLTSAFRFDEGPSAGPVLPDTSGPLALAKYEAASLPKPGIPDSGQSMPEQEKGERKRV